MSENLLKKMSYKELEEKRASISSDDPYAKQKIQLLGDEMKSRPEGKELKLTKKKAKG